MKMKFKIENEKAFRSERAGKMVQLGSLLLRIQRFRLLHNRDAPHPAMIHSNPRHRHPHNLRHGVLLRSRELPRRPRHQARVLPGDWPRNLAAAVPQELLAHAVRCSVRPVPVPVSPRVAFCHPKRRRNPLAVDTVRCLFCLCLAKMVSSLSCEYTFLQAQSCSIS